MNPSSSMRSVLVSFIRSPMSSLSMACPPPRYRCPGSHPLWTLVSWPPGHYIPLGDIFCSHPRCPSCDRIPGSSGVRIGWVIQRSMMVRIGRVIQRSQWSGDGPDWVSRVAGIRRGCEASPCHDFLTGCCPTFPVGGITSFHRVRGRSSFVVRFPLGFCDLNGPSFFLVFC